MRRGSCVAYIVCVLGCVRACPGAAVSVLTTLSASYSLVLLLNLLKSLFNTEYPACLLLHLSTLHITNRSYKTPYFQTSGSPSKLCHDT